MFPFRIDNTFVIYNTVYALPSYCIGIEIPEREAIQRATLLILIIIAFDLLLLLVGMIIFYTKSTVRVVILGGTKNVCR